MAARTRTKTRSSRKQMTRTRARAATTGRARAATTGRARAGAAAARTRARSRRGVRGGLSQKVQPDAALALIVGKAAVARTQLVRKFWAYVKTHNLQARN